MKEQKELTIDEIISSKAFSDLSAIMLENSKNATKRKYVLLNEVAKTSRAVMVGDSIVEQFPISELIDTQVYNRGISGDTSKEMLLRLNETVIALKPSKIFMWIGTNDIQAGLEVSEIVLYISKVCKQISVALPEAQINIISVAPVDVLSSDSHIKMTVGIRNNEKIKELNKAYRQFCEDSDINYIDIYSVLQENDSLINDYTEHGLHLTVRGYLPVCKVIKEYF